MTVCFNSQFSYSPKKISGKHTNQNQYEYIYLKIGLGISRFNRHILKINHNIQCRIFKEYASKYFTKMPSLSTL